MTALIVCSKSTLKYAKEMEGRVYQVTHPPNNETLDIIVPEDEIIAIGGGSVIDTAKIMGAQSGINTILAYPTTGAGASSTSHAVYWDAGRKHTIKTPKPITLFDINFVEGIPNHIWSASRHDAISHARESIASIHRTVISMRSAHIGTYTTDIMPPCTTLVHSPLLPRSLSHVFVGSLELQTLISQNHSPYLGLLL